jgi:hypothetical protein
VKICALSHQQLPGHRFSWNPSVHFSPEPPGIIPGMQWIYEGDTKPTKWEIVIAHCENSSGDIIVLDAYWTGQYWRIIGEKAGFRRLHVTMWSSKVATESE